MYNYVRNIFGIPNDDGVIEEFIMIETQNDFQLFEFLQKLQLLQNENFFNIETCLSVDDITNKNIQGLNTSINNLINQYSFLGAIDFKIETLDTEIQVLISMILNKEFQNSKTFNYSFVINKELK